MRWLCRLGLWVVLSTSWARADGSGFPDDTATVEPLGTFAAFRQVRVRFPSPVATPHPQNNVVWALYYEPLEGARLPAALVLHSWGARTAEKEQEICQALAERGVAALLMTLPYHGQRAPFEGSHRLMVSADVEQTLRAFEQAVADAGAAATWLAQQPRVDAQRLGLVGVSLGAIVGHTVMAREPRLKAGVLVLSGGSVGELIWRSALLEEVQQDLERRGLTPAELTRRWRGIDPLTHAPANAGKDILLINGLYDWVVPRSAVVPLWRAMGKPPLRWMRAGHYGGFLWKRRLIATIADFMEAHLKRGEPLPKQRESVLPAPWGPKVGIIIRRDGKVRPAFTLEPWVLDKRGRFALDVGFTPFRLLTGFSMTIVSVGDSGVIDASVGYTINRHLRRESYLAVGIHF